MKRNYSKRKINIELQGDRHFIEEFVQENPVYEVYKGKIASSKINNRIHFIVSVMLPEIYENVNAKTKEEVKEYYEKEQERIYSVLGIKTFDDFYLFIKKALESDCDFSNYDSLTYTKGSYEKQGDEEILKFKIKYEDGKRLNCIMYINSLSIEEVDARFEFE